MTLLREFTVPQPWPDGIARAWENLPRPAGNATSMKSLGRSGMPILAMMFLEACASAQLHGEEQLDQVAIACGLSVGDVVQESEEKRLLFLYRIAPKPQQRHCVYQWARRNHLTLVTINAVNEAPGPHS